MASSGAAHGRRSARQVAVAAAPPRRGGGGCWLAVDRSGDGRLGGGGWWCGSCCGGRRRNGSRGDACCRMNAAPAPWPRCKLYTVPNMTPCPAALLCCAPSIRFDTGDRLRDPRL